jgi:hypothetical protein
MMGDSGWSHTNQAGASDDKDVGARQRVRRPRLVVHIRRSARSGSADSSTRATLPDVATEWPGGDAHGEDRRLASQQQQIWADAATVQRYAEALPIDVFGGVWFDNDRDPVVFVLALTVPAHDHVAAVRRLVEHPDRVDVVRVDQSQSALRCLQDELNSLRGEYPISMLRPDVRDGVVVVGLSRDDAGARAAVERRFGSKVRVERGTWRGYAI